MSTHPPVTAPFSLAQLQQDIASLSPDAQQIIFDLVHLLKNKTTSSEDSATVQNTMSEWSDFIGCGEAESDLSRHYKTYLIQNLLML
ncbi:unknown protein [[Synechococcus] sp. NIES-970]|nr:unknown protein [[Synechococcus] sp. NIES-970]